MFGIVKIDGFIKTKLQTDGHFGKYGKAKEFKTKKDAKEWINRKSYSGMSWKYEVYKID